jgi:hypothetical protein
MATNLSDKAYEGSFLLELLHFAGWKLQVQDGETARIRANRGDVALDVTADGLAEAAGTAFARAMRSGRRRGEG